MPADLIRANIVTAALLAGSLGLVYSAFKLPAQPDLHINYLVLHPSPQDRDSDRDGDRDDCTDAAPGDGPGDCDDDDGGSPDDDNAPIQT